MKLYVSEKSGENAYTLKSYSLNHENKDYLKKVTFYAHVRDNFDQILLLCDEK